MTVSEQTSLPSYNKLLQYGLLPKEKQCSKCSVIKTTTHEKHSNSQSLYSKHSVRRTSPHHQNTNSSYILYINTLMFCIFMLSSSFTFVDAAPTSPTKDTADQVTGIVST